MTIRCPEQLAEVIEASRAKSGLTTNDFIVGLVEQAMAAGLIPPGPPAGQERLPLTA